jgi:phosphonate transport system substrate-binding protein
MRRWRSVEAILIALSAVLPAAALAQAGGNGSQPLLFGVVSFYNPRLMYLKYQPLVDYLSERSGDHWDLVISNSYGPTVAQLCDGTLAAAYLGPFTYVRAHAQCDALPVVRLRTGSKTTYQSFIMVKNESPITSLADLRGKTFGFGAPLSTSSHLVPRAMLAAAGLDAGRDYSCKYFWHHEKAARAVLLDEADACGIRDIVGTKFAQRGLRILARSAPIANFPFVLSPKSPAAVRDELIRSLVLLPRVDQTARETIAGWDEELAGGFELAEDSQYQGVREMARRLFGPLALSLPESSLACGPGGP